MLLALRDDDPIISKSKDCGDTWQYVGLLDPKDITLTFNNKATAGAAAYPQKDWLNQANNTTQIYQGGWDRQEIYADPWDGQTVYLTLWGGATDDRTTDWGPANKSLPSVARDLSLTNGMRRYWSPNNGEFVGDYMRGAFAFDGKLRFVAQWPERQPSESLRIRYNIITIKP